MASFSFIFTDNDIKLSGFTFACTLLGPVRDVLSNRFEVDKDIHAGVVIGEFISVPHVKAFNGSDHSLILVIA